jgi:hypothetical protein
MSALKKPNDSEITAEIVLPESIKKKSEALKKELLGSLEIEKTPALSSAENLNKNNDVLNFKRDQLASKTREIDTNKLFQENVSSQQLNSKGPQVHEELKKASEVLISETKKFAPLQKEIESGLLKISNLKSEMQHFFESNLNEKRKTTTLLEDQNREILKNGEMLKEVNSSLSSSLREITDQIQKLSKEKLSLHQEVAKLKEEISQKSSILQSFEQKSKQLSEINSSISSGMEKLTELVVLEEQVKQLQFNKSQLTRECDTLSHSIRVLNQDKSEMHINLDRLEISHEQLTNQVSARREQLMAAENELIDGKKRVEGFRSEEFDLQKRVQFEQGQLHKIMTEVAQLEGIKIAHQKLQEETYEYYQEKKSFYLKELELLEQTNHSRKSELDAAYEKSKIQWENEYREFSANKEKELQKKLDFMHREAIEDFKKIKKELSLRIWNAVQAELQNQQFTTQEDRSKAMKNEIENILNNAVVKNKKWKLWW